jgi:hypothetical protein
VPVVLYNSAMPPEERKQFEEKILFLFQEVTGDLV